MVYLILVGVRLEEWTLHNPPTQFRLHPLQKTGLECHLCSRNKNEFKMYRYDFKNINIYEVLFKKQISFKIISCWGYKSPIILENSALNAFAIFQEEFNRWLPGWSLFMKFRLLTVKRFSSNLPLSPMLLPISLRLSGKHIL